MDVWVDVWMMMAILIAPSSATSVNTNFHEASWKLHWTDVHQLDYHSKGQLHKRSLDTRSTSTNVHVDQVDLHLDVPSLSLDGMMHVRFQLEVRPY